MRVNSDITSRRILKDLTSNMERMQKSQIQISSGKRIERPSDDPVGISQDLSYKTEAAELKQFKANINNGIGWLDSTANVLSNTEDDLLKIIEYANQGNTGLITAEERQVLADQVDQLLEDIVDLANTKVSGKAIFGGTQTLADPFTAIIQREK